MTDAQLLANFATHKDQSAFAELVHRHIDWVYSLAHRLVSDPQSAEDVTQAVFILVAQKAPLLAAHRQFNGWLFRATRFCAANALKQQATRRHHEQEAAAMCAEKPRSEPDANPLWQEIAPHLDAALARLSAPDREALLLKFYQNKTAAEVGASLGVSEQAAKKRLQRTLDRLRTALAGAAAATSSSALGATLTTHVTQAAPPTILPAILTAKSVTAAATLAKAAANAMWWAQAKIAAAILLTTAVAGTVSYEAISHTLSATPPALAAPTPPPAAPQPTPPPEFDSLYEKAPPSNPDLTMHLGPNTFAVKAIIRFDANNKPIAIDNRGHPLDPATLSLASAPSPGGAWSFGERVLIQLDPAPNRYDIDRLRIFDHALRRHISNILVRPIPGMSALELRALPGTLPEKIDLWLAVASYDPSTSAPTVLPAIPTATAAIGPSTISFLDIRDGSWNYTAGRPTTLSGDAGEATSFQLQTASPIPGRYQLAAVAKDGRKYLSDFFLDFSFRIGNVMQVPLGLAQIDHFELRPDSRHPPFYFDGVPLPTVANPATADNGVPVPIIIKATGDQTDLPSGATVEFAGISHHPSDGTWWGIDGTPVDPPRGKSHGSITTSNGELPRELFGRAFGPKRSYDIIWDFDPGCSWAGGSDGKTSHITAALPKNANVIIRFGVSGPWHTLEEIPLSHLPASVEKWPGTIAPLRQQGDDLLLSMSLLPLPANVHFTLIDNNGKEKRSIEDSVRSEEKLPPWGTELFHATYHNLHLNDVRSLRLETSQFEYAEYTNIPLEPH